jgi:hypothetical protein
MTPRSGFYKCNILYGVPGSILYLFLCLKSHSTLVLIPSYPYIQVNLVSYLVTH